MSRLKPPAPMAPREYPDLLSVQDPAAGDVTRLAVEEREAADFRSFCSLLAWLAGHGACTWECDGHVIRCEHKTLYQVISPASVAVA